ncbi:MAG: AAA family ATPase [Desulfovibrio sp.]|nr:AAA family ATPase [Desulfovibrio sp.]
MAHILALGIQSFVKLRQNAYFYVDKSRFIEDWWTGGYDVTLITRPRRFGKTLMLDTVRTFFAPECRKHAHLFEGLAIWNTTHFRALQGAIPVIYLSFASVKSTTYATSLALIKALLSRLYDDFEPTLDVSLLTDREKKQLASVDMSMTEAIAQDSLLALCKYLARQNNVLPIILLDEYDTPLQEAWLNGYWDELAGFLRGLFNATFKSNPWLGRGLLTGITRISKESIFSDVNNPALKGGAL